MLDLLSSSMIKVGEGATGAAAWDDHLRWGMRQEQKLWLLAATSITTVPGAELPVRSLSLPWNVLGLEYIRDNCNITTMYFTTNYCQVPSTLTSLKTSLSRSFLVLFGF